MNTKVIKKIAAGILLIYPAMMDAWDAMIDNDNNAILDNTTSAAYCRNNPSILIQNGYQSVKYGKFWLYEPDPWQGRHYAKSTTEKFYYLSDVPTFMPVYDDAHYKYPKSKIFGGINMDGLGTSSSEILMPYTNVICCLQLSKDGDKRWGNNFIEQMIFYRYKKSNRYLFFAPAAKLHHILDKNDSEEFELHLSLSKTISWEQGAKNQINDFPDFDFQKHYVDKKITTFYTMNLGEKDGFALSGLASQGRANWLGRVSGGQCGLPGIRLLQTANNQWITTQIKAKGRTFLTHHIFLNENFTQQVHNALFRPNNHLPECLRDYDTVTYGDLVSFLWKLESNEAIRKDPILADVLDRLHDELNNEKNPSHEQYLQSQKDDPTLKAQENKASSFLQQFNTSPLTGLKFSPEQLKQVDAAQVKKDVTPRKGTSKIRENLILIKNVKNVADELNNEENPSHKPSLPSKKDSPALKVQKNKKSPLRPSLFNTSPLTGPKFSQGPRSANVAQMEYNVFHSKRKKSKLKAKTKSDSEDKSTLKEEKIIPKRRNTVISSPGNKNNITGFNSKRKEAVKSPVLIRPTAKGVPFHQKNENESPTIETKNDDSDFNLNGEKAIREQEYTEEEKEESAISTQMETKGIPKQENMTLPRNEGVAQRTLKSNISFNECLNDIIKRCKTHNMTIDRALKMLDHAKQQALNQVKTNFSGEKQKNIEKRILQQILNAKNEIERSRSGKK
ncbi:MAG: hypothetical protein LBB11_03215 [Puniceicoccales bacterium]|nr:hypothetical protein [Puniceicoccales bacterium]